MCRTSLTLYEWCRCEEGQILEACHTGRVSPSGSCDSVDSETVRLHCYCRHHATQGFLSIHKERKKQKKLEKKRNKRASIDSDSSSRFRKSLNSLRRLSFD